ncbi:hypothetical protein PPYR_14951 [Photinus pyralis]|uniref:mannose-6-phosphate isomerase n=1 Tax=Photinus pyralis TaxID=7054 RepID=A0A5N4A0L5_PHOPY|nr:mannose-6-phosphate isomerase [Photinus pyralis]KAB0790864.1 hypothetical protein PPYR_14951 [Photinus pyralis]
MELQCEVQTYEWGKLGLDSKVAVLHKLSNPTFEVGEDTPYAELWMGTHRNAPSRVKETGELLSAVIETKPEYLGEPVRLMFGNELPFLLKILSINKALSIQAHPSKEIARELHKSNPEVYKNPNHKPEFAIALTPFEALCGFRPIAEIKEFMKNIRELRAIVGVDISEKFILSDAANEKDMLKTCFRSLMLCPQDVVSAQLKQLLFKFSGRDEKTREEQMAPLLERLYSQFPDDIGCFVVYFLNYVVLQPNEAIYLGANEPHAYLSGDCVECMACSDNIVRAGLTPKYKDVETLCRILTYQTKPAREQLLRPTVEDAYCQAFKPPVPDFAVIKIEVPAAVGDYTLKPRQSASVLIVIGGGGRMGSTRLKAGTVVFIPANEKYEIVDITQDILMFQAMANVDMF